MEDRFKKILWQQFGAAIDMLENAIVFCPETLWNTPANYWYISYHTLFYLDYYLDGQPMDFLPPGPFTLSEFDEDGAMPERIYSKDELLAYVTFNRKKCHDLIASLTTESAAAIFANKYKNYTVLEIILYNMRHVQHHTAQLNLLLRQNINDAPQWVSRTKESL